MRDLLRIRSFGSDTTATAPEDCPAGQVFNEDDQTCEDAGTVTLPTVNIVGTRGGGSSSSNASSSSAPGGTSNAMLFVVAAAVVVGAFYYLFKDSTKYTTNRRRKYRRNSEDYWKEDRYPEICPKCSRKHYTTVDEVGMPCMACRRDSIVSQQKREKTARQRARKRK